MADLNSEIIAYLTVNNIPYTSGDYQTGQPEGQPNQILSWNTEKLGEQPTQEQLDEAYPIWEQQQKADQNSAQAKTILTNTDWTSIADVANPLKSNPYLMNQAEFTAYRSTIRNIAVNPTWDAVFPTAPTEVWGNA